MYDCWLESGLDAFFFLFVNINLSMCSVVFGECGNVERKRRGREEAESVIVVGFTGFNRRLCISPSTLLKLKEAICDTASLRET